MEQTKRPRKRPSHFGPVAHATVDMCERIKPSRRALRARLAALRELESPSEDDEEIIRALDFVAGGPGGPL